MPARHTWHIVILVAISRSRLRITVTDNTSDTVLICRICQWMTWERWGQCNAMCPGYHTRKRLLCCNSRDLFDTCVQKCGRSKSDASQTAKCHPKCVFGYSSGSACVCRSRGYGKCCQYSKYSPCYYMHSILL